MTAETAPPGTPGQIGASARASSVGPASGDAAANPPIPALLLGMTSVEAVVLLFSGVGLAFLPEQIARWWPWADLTTFNSRFLGAVYLTALVTVACLLAVRRWSPARVVVPMIGTFTLSVIVVSVAHLGRFEFVDRPLLTVGWFVLYVALPAGSFWYLRRMRYLPGVASRAGAGGPLPPPVGELLPDGWRYGQRVLAVLLLGYGLALLAVPEPATDFWPWTVDAFHGRMYAATFLAGGVGSWLVAAESTRADRLTVGAMQAAFGLLSVTLVYLVDVETGRVDWAAAGTLGWLAMMLTGAAAGLLLAARSLPSESGSRSG